MRINSDKDKYKEFETEIIQYIIKDNLITPDKIEAFSDEQNQIFRDKKDSFFDKIYILDSFSPIIKVLNSKSEKIKEINILKPKNVHVLNLNKILWRVIIYYIIK